MPQKHTAARSRVSGRHARGRNIQVFWQQNSGPAHSTLQFGAESGEDSSGTGQQRGSPGPGWQQNHLDSCSHQHPGPSSRPLHTNSRCGTNTQRDMTMGCFWVEPWLPARAIRRFTVIIWASLALTVTSCGAGHPLVDEKWISWLMKIWKVLFKTNLRIITQTENLRKLWEFYLLEVKSQLYKCFLDRDVY